jgi:hypothetical protein
MRRLFVFQFLVLLFLSGCDKPETDYIISAVGSYGDVAIITSSEQLQQRLFPEFESINSEEIFVLKKEKTLSFRYFQAKHWKNARNYRNIIIALDWSDGGKVQGLVKGMLSEERLNKLLSSPGGLVVIKDPWYRNQFAIVVVANSSSKLKKLLKDKNEIISREIYNSNMERLMSDNKKRGFHVEVVANYKKHLGLSIEFPLDYRQNQIMPDGYKGLEWIIPGPPTRGISLGWIETDDCKLALEDIEFLTEARSELGKYLHSETIVMSSLKWGEEKLAGIDAVRLSGSWVSDEVGVGGPFKCYFVPDPSQKQIICIDLLVYAPDKEKMEYFRKMRSVIETLSFSK